MSAESDKVTPGVWKVVPSIHGPRYACVQMGDDENYTTLELKPADAALIASAPTLAAELAKLREDSKADALDAARYRWLRNEAQSYQMVEFFKVGMSLGQIDSAIDDALSKAKGRPG